MTDDLLLLMTVDAHRRFCVAGCDPHCHVCGTPIGVGDMYSLKLFIERPVVAGQPLAGDIRGTACKDCTIADRPLPSAERQRLEHTLQQEVRREAIDRLRDPPVPRERRSHGCYVAADGTLFTLAT